MTGEVGASRPHERGGWSSKGRFGGLKRKIWRKMKMKERLGLKQLPGSGPVLVLKFRYERFYPPKRFKKDVEPHRKG